MSERRPREDRETKNRTNCIIYLHNSKKGCTFAADFTFQIVKKMILGSEYAPLLRIKDVYPKFIIALTRVPKYDYQGIQIIDLAEWLLDR